MRRWAGATPTLLVDGGSAAPAGGPMDPQRATKILGWLLHRGLVRKTDVRATPPAGLNQLLRVHTREHLERLDDRGELERVLPGLPPSARGNEIVSWQRRMVGGTTLAAHLALDGPPRLPIVHLGGGLHHARADRGAGFCLFHDVAVAITHARSRGFSGSVLVVDVDVHPGDGTRALFAEDESVFTFSVHAEDWDDDPAVADLAIPLGAGVGDAADLAPIRGALPDVVDRVDPALVFVVGGTDVAFDDPMGSWHVSPDGVLERDRSVLAALGERPIVWTLAGGYGLDSWRYTARTLGWLYGGSDAPISSSVERALHAFRRVRGSLSTSELGARPGAGEIDLSDVLLDLMPGTAHSRLLDTYTEYGVELALDRYGVLEHLRARGYDAVRVEFELDHGTGQRAQVFSADARRDQLVDLVLRETRQFKPWRLLWIEWLLLQDPRRAPTDERPLLPGQEHPGLGAVQQILGMLMMSCERLGYDGLAFNPAWYHVAAMSRGPAQFLDPEDAARFDALHEQLARRPLLEATAEAGDWAGRTMVVPVSDALKEACGAPSVG